MTDNEVGPQAQVPDRLQRLTGYFLDMADSSAPNELATRQYIAHGGSLRLCLNEIEDLDGPCAEDQAIDAARLGYMTAVLKRPFVPRRSNYYRVCAEREENYVDSVAMKIKATVDSETPDDALRLRQMPSLLEKITFKDGEEMTLEQLAANHLYLLVDVALKEHVKRRQIIDHYRKRSLTAQLVGNRALHMVVAGGIFAASFVPHLGILPGSSDIITDDVDLGLRVLSGTILGLDAPEAIRLQYLDAKHNRRTHELHEQLAQSRELTDRALRIVYSSTRYGGSSVWNIVTHRSGTDDKAENLRRFDRLDEEFPHLNNDPGGKPYTANQAVGYAARLLIERQDQLLQIVNPRKPAAERRQLFLTLSKEILVEDVTRMKKGINVSRFRRRIMNMLAVVPATFFPSTVSAISDASSLGHDTVGALSTAENPDLET